MSTSTLALSDLSVHTISSMDFISSRKYRLLFELPLNFFFVPSKMLCPSSVKKEDNYGI